MAAFHLLKKIDANQLSKLIDSFQKEHVNVNYQPSRHLLEFSEGEELSVRLPFFIKYEHHKIIPSNFLIVLIHSGEAALAYSEEDQITEHKMVKAYMVRQKQGKSQIKHLKTKGKSKAGSRVRLAGTDHFFEEINEKISEWNEYYDIDKIAISCNKTLQPYFFNRSDAALKKDDNRIIKIPKHIQEANFENLTSIHKYLISTELNFENSEKDFIKELVLNITNE
ncbi:hypothetical protein [Marivirga harenae]|uniref:hypothetical protein n=1 Tax=Marivirga harenae TaxID=2010992 RepID=UPI0026DF8D8C|nr:hypothetical protein [Marivirga harenae]WKV11770.1 hypothetical protein Q3Y49_16330 [Marivirga harenae]|tara:strand:+ start:9621 stop:10292 length:672 start_codon:yes stop_codon:yes gene_type:complete